ncbi:DNA-binding protein [Microbacterium hominis]|uniref:DNA-binding protein n=1 Tax=Microbacterium hominis TaxID=162426 RepID=A0A7D4UJN7_9MICO|nr:DNA-binding protein [Microbacterium hominis]QKJ19767.1 DNA-binding protein [Microbacterium hominis]
MFVITTDQRGSRRGTDLVPQGIAAIRRAGAPAIALAPERTAGDEVQVALTDAAAVLATVLDLTRAGTWSVGVGVGEIETPLPDNVRAGRGSAFVRARSAVEQAKRAPGRIALVGADGDEAPDAEALVRTLVDIRDRRTAEGWEVYDLLATGRSQRDAAEELAISESAVSLRAKAAALRVEEAAVPALVRLLERADVASGARRTPLPD